jgi:hypothetical protein
MKNPILVLTLGCLLCSCSKSSTWIPESQAKTLCMQFIYKSGFTNSPALIMEQVNGRFCIYRFMQNGAVVPGYVRVDRQSSRAEFRK